MLPIPCVLQYLDPAQCDVLVLHDPLREYYDAGLPGYASSFLGILERLRRDVPLARLRRRLLLWHQRRRTAAVRAGLLLGADRAIAASVSIPWRVTRLQNPAARPFPAFEPICACWRDTRHRPDLGLWRGNEKDCEHAARLAAVLPVRQLVFDDVGSHNLFIELARTGRADAFFRRIFRLGKELGNARPEKPRHDLLSLLPAWLGGVARPARGDAKRRRKGRRGSRRSA